MIRKFMAQVHVGKMRAAELEDISATAAAAIYFYSGGDETAIISPFEPWRERR